jgi:hypothetical protein
MYIKKEGMVAAATIALFACLLLCVPALADYTYNGFAVETRANDTINGGVFIDYEPWDGTTTLTGNFDVPDGVVKWARLYVGVWGGAETRQGWVNVTFNGFYDRNGLGPIHLQGKKDTNPNVWGSGHGKHWMYYNVTNLTSAGSTNVGHYSVINGTLDEDGGRCYGIVLVVIYEGGANPEGIQYWINDGNDGLHAGPYPPAHNSGTTYFNGSVDVANVTRANLTMVHLTGYEPGCDRCLTFNGHELNTSMVDSNTFELNSWNVTDYLAPEVNKAGYCRGDDGHVSITNALLVITYEEGWGDLFDTGTPANPYPSISGTHNGTIRVYKNITVNRMYTHACSGTGGHTESVKIWNDTTGECIEAHWNGYSGDYHDIAFNGTLTMKKGVIYNYTIRTGSYPLVHHRDELTLGVGIIRCTNFTDANGKRYYDWIPAITLYYE